VIWTILLGAAPWALLGGFLLFGIRAPRPLPRVIHPPSSRGVQPAREATQGIPATGATSHDLSSQPFPTVTIVVPARNEARSIIDCVGSLAFQEYPDFDIVVVDDDSIDGTGDLALSVPHGRAREIRVIQGKPLPEGWFGKPWACHQGAGEAKGDLLLFTDADTRHAPDLLSRAVAGMLEDGVQALTLNGRQEARSLGELLIQPQMFALIGIRYSNLDQRLPPDLAGDAIANGQYILVEKRVYDEIGGHEAVKGEVAEDLRLAQVLTAAGYPVVFRDAIDSFSTRMYQSLREAIAGWTKNVAVGGQQAAGKLAPLAPIGMIGYLVVFWIIPPLTFLLLGGVAVLDVAIDLVRPSGYGAAPPTLFTDSLFLWSRLTIGLSVITWIGLYRRFQLPIRYALLYPIGAGLVTYIALRSWMRGSGRIEWKGRRYSGGKSTS